MTRPAVDSPALAELLGRKGEGTRFFTKDDVQPVVLLGDYLKRQTVYYSARNFAALTGVHVYQALTLPGLVVGPGGAYTVPVGERWDIHAAFLFVDWGTSTSVPSTEDCYTTLLYNEVYGGADIELVTARWAHTGENSIHAKMEQFERPIRWENGANCRLGCYRDAAIPGTLNTWWGVIVSKVAK